MEKDNKHLKDTLTEKVAMIEDLKTKVVILYQKFENCAQKKTNLTEATELHLKNVTDENGDYNRSQDALLNFNPKKSENTSTEKSDTSVAAQSLAKSIAEVLKNVETRLAFNTDSILEDRRKT